MKLLVPILISTSLAVSVARAEEPVPTGEERAAEITAKHREGAGKVADAQDELSADVQQLRIEQTVPEVIELLTEVEDIMDEATDSLAEPDTGPRTTAAQTEIIEKIHAAAKARQQQEGAGQAGGAMMDMLERMMGSEPGQQQPGQQGPPGDAPGGPANKTAESDTANESAGGTSNERVEERRVPKAAGVAGRSLPPEFQKALDAYNRGAERKAK